MRNTPENFFKEVITGMSRYNIELGKRGEQMACDFLKYKGFQIVEQNYRTKYGEIDIVAKDKKTWVFVEVKTRTNLEHGLAAEAVNSKKISSLIKAASQYVQDHSLEDKPCRFDVIEIYMADQITMNHIMNAFEA